MVLTHPPPSLCLGIVHRDMTSYNIICTWKERAKLPWSINCKHLLLLSHLLAAVTSKSLSILASLSNCGFGFNQFRSPFLIVRSAFCRVAQKGNSVTAVKIAVV